MAFWEGRKKMNKELFVGRIFLKITAIVWGRIMPNVESWKSFQLIKN